MTERPTTADLDRRDLTLDLARVVCVLMVVTIHLLFVGVGPDADGGLSVSRPLEELPWFWTATWVGQIMPLFFVVGGFATATSLRSLRRREPDPDRADRMFVHTRMQRLIRPALPLFIVLAAALGVATAIGVDPRLLEAVATGIGSPLWFLCAYLLCQFTAPTLLRLHERAPRATVIALLACVVAVDIARFLWADAPRDQAGVGIGGYLNLLFVWALVHQIGFWYADGWFARRRAWQLIAIAAVAWASLVPLTAFLPYSLDMLSNLNPPTIPLVALGIGQAALLQLLKPPLTALMRTRAARGVVYVIGSRLMTIYVWHLPLIIVLAGIGLLLPGASPVPGSAEWWATRPLVLVVLLAALIGLSVPLRRFEQPVAVTEPASRPVLALTAMLAVVPTFFITVFGLDLASAVAGAIGFGLGALLLGAGQKPKSPKSDAPNSELPKSDPASPPSAAPASGSAPALSPHGRNALMSADPTT